jgi:PAS domain S-box-containing protein
MGLRKRFLTIIIGIQILVIIIFFVGANLFLDRSFSALEQNQLHVEVDRATSAINAEIDHINSILHDWSSWDDTYNYMAGEYPDFITNNFMDSTFANLGINYAVLIDNNSKIVYSKAYDLLEEKEVPVPDAIIAEFNNNNLIKQIKSSNSIKGIMVLPDSKVMVTIRPILSSFDTGEPRGWFMMGQLLDESIISRLTDLTKQPIYIYSKGNPDIPEEIANKLVKDNNSTTVESYPIDNNKISGYSLINDIYNSPDIVVRVDIPRDLYAQGQMIIYTFVTASIIFAAIFVIITMVFVDRLFLSRIIDLSKRVVELGTKGDRSARLTVKGKDEISALAQEINNTLNKLEESQDALNRSQKLYATLVENSNDGIVIIDKGLLKFANRKMVAITDYSVDELIGKRFTDLISTEYKEFVADDFNRRVTGNHLPDKYETTMLSKDGRKIFVEISLNTIELEKKPVVIAFIRDITMRKLVQEQLITTDRLASIGELAAGVAHELSNPLTSVMGYTQLLLEQDVPTALRKDLEIVNSEAKRAADVTKNLLMFARRYAPEKQLISINELIEKVLEIRNYEQKINNIKVIKDFAGDLKQIVGDPSQLQQVFINIIINAEYSMIKAHHGGTLKIRTQNLEGVVRISFADDGIGIPGKELPRIFDPFYTTKYFIRGTGLGLSICHGIILRHNGRIYAESESGQGATFIIELPKANVKV